VTEHTNIDDYIAAQSENVQEILQSIRQTIRAAAPGAEECISYGMPAFRQGKVLIYFAAMKHHISIYPTNDGMAAFANRLGEYKTSKGAIQLPYDKPIPYDLIAEIARFRAAVKEP
jgi:uncharacterized protein YdhG (YjbR/CyaY superfamily)